MKKLFTILLLFVGFGMYAQTYVYPYKVIDANTGRARQMKEGDVLRAYGTNGISFDKLNALGLFLSTVDDHLIENTNNFAGVGIKFAGAKDGRVGSSYVNTTGIANYQSFLGTTNTGDFSQQNFVTSDSSGVNIRARVTSADISIRSFDDAELLSQGDLDLSGVDVVSIFIDGDTVRLQNNVLSTTADVLPSDTGIDLGSLSSPFDTVVAQKLIVDSNSIVFRGTEQSISATSEGISMANCNTGWASYSDGQFVTDTPFILSTTDTWITLPNDAETVINSQLPCGVDSFYNTTDSTIVSNGSGDDIIITILFKVRPNNNNQVEFDFSLDIGGAIGQTFEDTRTYHKGQDVQHFFNATYSAYTLDTWAANGAKPKVRTNESVDIYDIQYVIKRTHKAR